MGEKSFKEWKEQFIKQLKEKSEMKRIKKGERRMATLRRRLARMQRQRLKT